MSDSDDSTSQERAKVEEEVDPKDIQEEEQEIPEDSQEEDSEEI
jgi:hypothetical protein